jgi:hypothetical protein
LLKALITAPNEDASAPVQTPSKLMLPDAEQLAPAALVAPEPVLAKTRTASGTTARQTAALRTQRLLTT